MDPEFESTRRLIEAARAGRQEAYELLFQTYRKELERRVQGRFPAKLQHRLEASDVVQDALTDAVRHFESFRYRGKRSFRNWLLRILENRIRMAVNFHLVRRRRDSGREVPLPDTSPAESKPSGPVLAASVTSPSDAAARRERQERLEQALNVLPRDYGEVIRRVRIQGQSLAEAAEAMGRSQNAIKKLLARALLRLRESLREEEV
ncbi:MAG: sigma-70 family RNA polymerase sigma factor [Planctomycetota bacterium]